MGMDISCLNSSHLPTVTESNINNTFTDGEQTEFLANASSFYLEEVYKNNSQKSKHTLSVITEPYPKLNSSSSTPVFTFIQSTPSPGKQGNPQPPIPKTRIYSSNLSMKSVNIIEKLNQSGSACTTNFESKTNSRCVSPLFRTRSALID